MAAFTEEQVKDFSIKNWYDLSGQVAVVTGGATGLGLALTRCLVSAGANSGRVWRQGCVLSVQYHRYRPRSGTGR